MSKFPPAAWHYAGLVVTSGTYEDFVAWVMREIPVEWRNGLAAHITHLKPTYPSWDDLTPEELGRRMVELAKARDAVLAPVPSKTAWDAKAEQEIREIGRKLDAGEIK